MKAVRYHEYGDESVLRHEEAERPTAGPGQVLLQVAGTAFNPVDVAIRAGYLRQGLPLSFPHVPGFDVAGTVVELGDGVQELRRRHGDDRRRRPLADRRRADLRRHAAAHLLVALVTQRRTREPVGAGDRR